MNTRHLAAAFCLTIYLLPISSFAMSGNEWYKACTELFVLSDDQVKSAPPDKKISYRACQIEANRAWCEANLQGDAQNVTATMSREMKTQIFEQLDQVCPTSMSMPFGGPYPYVVIGLEIPYIVIGLEIEKRGGPGFFEKWFPASEMLHAALLRKYPACRKEREKLGLFEDSEKCFDAWNKNIKN